jgi:hypothetical protein
MSRVFLAYLFDVQGKPALADEEWSALAIKPKPEQAAVAPTLKPKEPGQTGT